jgi:Na+/H+ antiporter NhaD/arsenite permease-like protein
VFTTTTVFLFTSANKFHQVGTAVPGFEVIAIAGVLSNEDVIFPESAVMNTIATFAF